MCHRVLYSLFVLYCCSYLSIHSDSLTEESRCLSTLCTLGTWIGCCRYTYNNYLSFFFIIHTLSPFLPPSPWRPGGDKNKLAPHSTHPEAARGWYLPCKKTISMRDGIAHALPKWQGLFGGLDKRQPRTSFTHTSCGSHLFTPCEPSVIDG